MSVFNTCKKILNYALTVMKEDGYNETDSKEIFQYSVDVINKSKIPKDIKDFLLKVFESYTK